jgi:hypothetical protein
MKTDKKTRASGDIIAFLAKQDEDVIIDGFVDSCRRSPLLRRWLWTEFVRSKRVREGFKAVLDDPDKGAGNGRRLLRRLAGNDGLVDATTQRIQKHMGVETGRIYGGLTWSEVENWVRHYHAGTLDTGAFLLVHDWRESAKTNGVSPRLTGAAAILLNEAICGRDKRLLRHLMTAVDFLDEFTDARASRVALGHVNWWKVSVLLYLLNHPKPAYRTRELRAHLAGQGLDIETKDLRRFCSRHGIKRDMRAGRPVSRQPG